MHRWSRVPLFVLALAACRETATTEPEVAGGGGGKMTSTDGATPGVPPTRREDVVDTIHGREVADPYRWLEDVANAEVKAWMKAQDAHARARLEALPGRAELEKRLAELSYIDSVSPPTRRGERYFYTRSHRDKEKDIYYVRKGEQGKEEVLMDPNTLSPDGSVSVHGIMPSRSGRYLAYKLSRNNADASTMYVRDLDTGAEMPTDTIEGARYAYAAWLPDDSGFYYVNLPTDPSIPVEQLPGHAEVRFHALGSDPSKDPVVYPAAHDPTRFVNASVSRDGRWLFVTHQRGWAATDVYVADLHGKRGKPDPKRRAAPEFKPLVKDQPAV